MWALNSQLRGRYLFPTKFANSDSIFKLVTGIYLGKESFLNVFPISIVLYNMFTVSKN